MQDGSSRTTAAALRTGRDTGEKMLMASEHLLDMEYEEERKENND